jgi:hypothetical protein
MSFSIVSHDWQLSVAMYELGSDFVDSCVSLEMAVNNTLYGP